MMISRAFSIFLRLGEFVSAAIVLGIMAYFIESRRRWGGPLAREIYTLVIAALSAILALIWLLLSTKRMMHYPLDLLTSAAWFAAFGTYRILGSNFYVLMFLGILINYMHNRGCGRWFEWGYIGLRGSRCGQWKVCSSTSPKRYTVSDAGSRLLKLSASSRRSSGLPALCL
jgi:hypothetical protein